MKQYITDKQWDELTQNQKTEFCDFFEDVREFAIGMSHPVSIGLMIEFLGNNWVKLYNDTLGRMTVEDYIEIDEMCDNLWEAVKYKLNE